MNQIQIQTKLATTTEAFAVKIHRWKYDTLRCTDANPTIEGPKLCWNDILQHIQIHLDSSNQNTEYEFMCKSRNMLCFFARTFYSRSGKGGCCTARSFYIHPD